VAKPIDPKQLEQEKAEAEKALRKKMIEHRDRKKPFVAHSGGVMPEETWEKYKPKKAKK